MPTPTDAPAETPQPSRQPLSIARTMVAVTLLGIVVAAVPLLFLDPQANDGAAVLFAVVGVPALVSATLIQVVGSTLVPGSRFDRHLLWLPLLVLPLAITLCTVPTILNEPEYFEAESFWGIVGALALMLLLAVIGLLVGTLVWFFVLFPLAAIGRLLVAAARGEKVAPSMLVMPAILLVLGAIAVILGLSLEDLHPGRMAAGQIIGALLGIPGSYAVTWEPGLWIARALIVLVLLAWLLPLTRRRAAQP